MRRTITECELIANGIIFGTGRYQFMEASAPKLDIAYLCTQVKPISRYIDGDDLITKFICVLIDNSN